MVSMLNVMISPSFSPHAELRQGSEVQHRGRFPSAAGKRQLAKSSAYPCSQIKKFESLLFFSFTSHTMRSVDVSDLSQQPPLCAPSDTPQYPAGYLDCASPWGPVRQVVNRRGHS